MEFKYGPGMVTERNVIMQCITNLTRIESVIDVKGLEIIHQYLAEKLVETK
jgi:hypothetical protein